MRRTGCEDFTLHMVCLLKKASLPPSHTQMKWAIRSRKRYGNGTGNLLKRQRKNNVSAWKPEDQYSGAGVSITSMAEYRNFIIGLTIFSQKQKSRGDDCGPHQMKFRGTQKYSSVAATTYRSYVTSPLPFNPLTSKYIRRTIPCLSWSKTVVWMTRRSWFVIPPIMQRRTGPAVNYE